MLLIPSFVVWVLTLTCGKLPPPRASLCIYVVLEIGLHSKRTVLRKNLWNILRFMVHKFRVNSKGNPAKKKHTQVRFNFATSPSVCLSVYVQQLENR